MAQKHSNEHNSSASVPQAHDVYLGHSRQERPNTARDFPESKYLKDTSDAQGNNHRQHVHPFMKRPGTASDGDHFNSELSNFTTLNNARQPQNNNLTPYPLGQTVIDLEDSTQFDLHRHIGRGEGGNRFGSFINLRTQESCKRNQYALEIEAECPISPLHSSYQPVAIFLTKNQSTSVDATGDTDTPKLSILRTCGQISAIPIELVFNAFKNVLKLSEGVYGEVFTGELWGCGAKPNVFKIVPVEGNKMMNDLKQKRYHEIESEIKISQLLNKLRDEKSKNYTTGFAQLNCARILKGKYPEVLTSAWKSWDRDRQSLNDFPDFEERQRYVVFETPFSGDDLPQITFGKVSQAWSCIMQVIFSLAVAERDIEFEHRDLHWGNVLIQQTQEQTEFFRLDGVGYRIPTHGIKAVIIDFTLSRAVDGNKVPIFNDLSKDEGQFTINDEDYQFEIYRMMRIENGNNWSNFHPKTNVFWIHYLCKKLIGEVSNLNPGRPNVNYLDAMKKLRDTILYHPSCSNIAKRHFEFVDRRTS